jgi:hypothetical protein
MRRPRLEVVEGQEVDTRERSSAANYCDTRLWQRATDKTVHLFLREPAITELARKKDPAILDLCETLLSSDDADDWQVAVNALAEMKTAASIDRLIALYIQSDSDDRSLIIQKVAYCLTSDHASSFEKMLRELPVPCEIDVFKWSSSAKAVLGALCSRVGLTMTYARPEQGRTCLVIS